MRVRTGEDIGVGLSEPSRYEGARWGGGSERQLAGGAERGRIQRLERVLSVGTVKVI